MKGEEIKLIRPINKFGNITKLDKTDLTSINSNIFKDFGNKTTLQFDKLNKELFNTLKLIPAFSEFFDKSKQNYKNFEIVFPKGVLEKLKSGEYLLNKKKGTDEFLTFIKDKKTNNIVKQLSLKEISNSEKLKNIRPSLHNMAVMQSLNQITNKLEEIEKKLSEIHKEFNNDRIGLIQYGYNMYLGSIQMENLENKRQSLFSANKSLNDGRSQLIQSAKRRIANTEVGFFNSMFNSIKSPLTHRKNQKESIKEFIKEIFYIQRSSQIILTIHQELNEPKALIQSLATYYDFMTYINDEKIVFKLNEWESSELKWDDISKTIIKSIEQIPDYNRIENSEYILNINK
jgi:hypothetical protein